MKKIGSVFLFFILCFLSIYSQAEIRLKVELNPKDVGVGDQAQLTLLVTGDEDFEVETEPEFTNTDGVRLVDRLAGGRSSSSRMNIINGKTEFSKTVSQQYDFILAFDKAGSVSIPSMTALINGKNYATAGFKITVASKSLNDNRQMRPSPGFNQGQNTNPFTDEEDDDVFSQLMKQRQQILEEVRRQMGGGPGGQGGRGLPQWGMNQDPQGMEEQKLNINPNESFFLLADIDKKEVYEGEQITARWYIYVKGVIESLDRAKFPDLKGFWKEIIEEVPGLQFIPVKVNGVPYKRALLASHALFPIKAGDAVIDEFKIKAKVRNLTDFGWGQPHEFTKSSKRITVKVLPLPLENRPQSFSGAVGQFQIQAQVPNTEVIEGQPFSFKVRFEGQGNAKLIDLPPIEWPVDLELYDTKNESKFFKTGQSFKEFEILLIPRKAGEIKIPAIHFSYFDPEQKKYLTKSTEELVLNAKKSDTLKVGSDSVNEKKPEQDAVKAVGPILELPSRFSWIKWRMSVIYLALFSLFLIMFGRFVYDYSRIRSGPRHNEIIKIKLQKLNSQIQNKNLKSIGVEGVSIIYYLLEMFNQNEQKHSLHDSNEVTLQRLIDQLPIELKNKYDQKINSLFDLFQTLAFAPASALKNINESKDFDSEYSTLKQISDDFIARIDDSKET